jgi:hypothetical protein
MSNISFRLKNKKTIRSQEFDKLKELIYEWQALEREEQQCWKYKRRKRRIVTFI